MNIRRREGHEWTVVASRRGVNGTTDILWIESRRSLTWVRGERRRRARSAVAAGPAARARTARGGSGPGGSDVHTEHGGARRKCAAYLSGLRQRRLAPVAAATCNTREPACADTDIRKSARDHYLTNKLFVLLSKNIRVRRKALEEHSPSLHGVAHANRFPAAGRLMRAAAPAPAEAPTHAHLAACPFQSTRFWGRASGTSFIITVLIREPIVQRAGKNIRPSRLLVCVERSQRAVHTDAICSRIADARRTAAGVLLFDNFSRKLTCIVAVDEARPPATWPIVDKSYAHISFFSFSQIKTNNVNRRIKWCSLVSFSFQNIRKKPVANLIS